VAHPPSRFVRRSSADPFTRRDEALAFAANSAWTPPEWFARVHVVLFEPTDPVNIGVVLRAMGNTGFSRLRLANPTPFDPWNVIGVAHYTQHILEAAATFPNLPEAVSDLHFALGLTGKHHRLQRNALPFADAMRQLADEARRGARVGLVLGREDVGLTNAALDSCHATTTIPTNPAYPSLNLAQATLLALYELFRRGDGMHQRLRQPRRTAPPATSAELEDLFADLERALASIDYFHGHPRATTMRGLRAALYRARLDRREAALLRSIALDLRHFLHRRGIIPEMGPVGRARDAPDDSI
jgi:TrmH family RNA methyltransferase